MGCLRAFTTACHHNPSPTCISATKSAACCVCHACRLVNVLRTAGGSGGMRGNELDEFQAYYLAAHYVHVATRANEARLHKQAAMALTSCLRYVGIINADRVRGIRS